MAPLRGQGLAELVELPKERSTGNVFISYRREDSAPYAGRICDDLNAKLGDHRVFMDVEDIAPGVDFTQAIDTTLSKCEAVLAIIGPRWREVLERRQADNERDYVRHEIESALKRNIRVIPVLVGGADPKQLMNLPLGLDNLRFRQAVELRDSTFRDDLSTVARVVGGRSSMRFRTKKWRVAAAVAAIALIGLVSLYASRFAGGRRPSSQARQLLDTAEAQMELREYPSAFKTFGDAAALDQNDTRTKDRQVDAAMAWTENFSVVASQGEKDKAAPLIAQILPVLEAGFARTNAHGSRAADIMAHLGWAHWLNQKIAFKEFGDAPERDLRRSLIIEPSNVYGNAMLGNWLMQTNAAAGEALRHFDIAVKTGKERALVRTMQLGAMTDNDRAEVRRELIRVANEMRANNEPLSRGRKHRILSAFSPTLHDWRELMIPLTAVPPDDVWATYQWLEDSGGGSDDEWQRIQHDFIHAGILEVGGKKEEAFALFEDVQRRLAARNYSGRITQITAAAVKRLSP